MHKVNFTIIESSNWAQDCAAWMLRRGYDVSIIDQLPEQPLPQQQTRDLILLDEACWLANPSKIQKLIEAGKCVTVISAAYSIKGYKKAIEAGAKGYIDKQLDQDAFTREIEKTLRMAGMLSKRGRVLVVDNDPHVLNALKNNLERAGYIVYTANNAEDAIRSIELHQPHVSVVDIRLKDDEDRLDQSGFDLVEEINNRYGHAVKIVGLTGSPVRDTAAHAVGAMSGFALKDPKLKVDELVPKIEAAQEKLKINASLNIEFEGSFSLAKLVKTMKTYRDLDAEQQKTALTEVEELLRKLFRRELQVKAYYLAPGRGGSGVVLMRPIVEGTPGQYVVVKFGRRESIATELQNYNLYVKPFVGRWATQLVDIADDPEETLNLGGLKFTFMGISKENPRDFNTFYRDPATTQEQINKSLHYLFNETCANWYNAKRDWSDPSPDTLAKTYESQLILDRSYQQKKRADLIRQLTNGEPFCGLTLEHKKPDSLTVQLNGQAIDLPNPLKFTQERRVDFPVPKFECRTHGDLNGRNMFVDEDGRVWLIDFFKTRWGAVLRDFGELETVIKFELLKTKDLTALYKFEKAMLAPDSFDKPVNLAARFQPVDDLDQAYSTISQLRALAYDKFESSDMQEYYVGLLFYALKVMTWKGNQSIDRDRAPVRQRHALLSAAMIAHRLQHWGNAWAGWPDE